MTTRKSSSNFARALPFVRNTVRRNLGLLGFYWALSVLFLPIPFALSVYRARMRAAAYAQYSMPWYKVLEYSTVGASNIFNSFSALFYTFLVLAVPFLVSAVLFAYMHNRRSVDVYHALPLTRGELFLGSCAAGTFIMLVPLGFNLVVMGLFAFFIPGLSVGAVCLDFFVCAAIMLALFAIASFCATQVGTVQDQIMFALLVTCSLAGAVLILTTLADSFLYGFAAGSSFFEQVAKLCPFSLLVLRLFSCGTADACYAQGNIAALLWLLVAAALLLVSALLYARRRSEQAEVVGNLGFLQCYARAVGTLIGGVCLAWVICAVLDLNSMPVPMLIATALGGLVVYYIGDFILARRVRGLRATCKAALATVAVVCLICAVVIFDFTGFETRMPDEGDVVSVTLTDFDTRYSDQSESSYSRKLVLTDADDIAAVLSAHKNQIAVRNESFDTNGMSLDVTYRLRGGRTQHRAYSGLCDAAVLPLASLETSDEVLRQTAAVFRMDADTVSEVNVTRTSDGAQGTATLNASQKEALVTALQIDLLNQTAGKLEGGARGTAFIDITLKQKKSDNSTFSTVERESEGFYYSTYRYMLTDSFEKTASVLRAAGMSEYLRDETESLTAVGVTLYSAWSQQAYLVADGYEPSAYINSYDDESSLVMLTPAEYEALSLHRMSYYPNLSSQSGDLVGIVLFVDNTAQGGSRLACAGGYYARLSELPDSLRERVIAAWCSFNGIERESFEEKLCH